MQSNQCYHFSKNIKKLRKFKKCFHINFRKKHSDWRFEEKLENRHKESFIKVSKKTHTETEGKYQENLQLQISK